MGGKRPDQYRIDRDEGRTTDHKFLPDEPREADADDQRYSEVMEGEIRADQPVPPKRGRVPIPRGRRPRGR